MDGLRALAILIVLAVHGSHTAGLPDQLARRCFLQVAAMSMGIFFVISGFLITVLIFREIERTGGFNLAAFYGRRFLRLFPAYVCLLIVVAVLQYLGLSHPRSVDWAGALTCTINFVPNRDWDLGHCWFLCIEVHFNLVWALLVAVLPSGWRGRFAIGGIILSFGSRLVLQSISPRFSSLADDWTFCQMDDIAAGCLLAVWAWEGQPVLSRLTSLAWLGPLAALGLVASLSLATFSSKYGFVVAHTVNAACITVLVWIAACKGHWLLNSRLVVWVGTLSYSLYLWQQLFLNPFRHNWATEFPQNIVLAFLVATISYYLIEAPFLRIKNRMVASSSPEIADSGLLRADLSCVVHTAR